MTRSALVVLSIIDAPVVTGPLRGLLHLARYLPPRVRLHVALLRGRGAAPPPDVSTLSHGTLTAHELSEYGAFDATVIARAASLARDVGAHIVQSHSYKPHVMALGVRALSGVVWVAHHHGWTAENDRVKRYHRLDGVTLPRADRVVTVAEKARAVVEREGCAPGRVVVIANAVDVHDVKVSATRDEARARLGLDARATVACVVGRLSPEKGQDVALRALASLRDKHTMPVLAFAGDGPERASLEALTRTLGLGDNVVFLGHQPAVGYVYAASDLLLMPSRSEVMPNVLLEAMALGLPAVVTRVGGVDEMVDDGEHAWVVPPDDVAALGAALRAAVAHRGEAQRRAAAARVRVAERHDPARRAMRYVDLYESLLATTLGTWRTA